MANYYQIEGDCLHAADWLNTAKLQDEQPNLYVCDWVGCETCEHLTSEFKSSLTREEWVRAVCGDITEEELVYIMENGPSDLDHDYWIASGDALKEAKESLASEGWNEEVAKQTIEQVLAIVPSDAGGNVNPSAVAFLAYLGTLDQTTLYCVAVYEWNKKGLDPVTGQAVDCGPGNWDDR